MIAALIRSIRYTRRGAFAASAFVALAFSTVPTYFAADYRQSSQQQLSAEAERHLQGRIALAQEMLDQAKAVPGIIAPTLSRSSDPEQTETTVRNLLKMGRIVESIRVAPDNGPSTTIYRSESAQHNPLNAAALPRSAILSVRQPHAAVGDGTLVISQPLAELDTQGKPHHWGSLVADASIGYLIQELQLLALVREGFGVSFRVQWQSGAPDTVIYTGGNIDDISFSRSTPLVGGELLTLTIAPPAPAATGLSILSQLGILLSGALLFAFTYYLLRRPQELEREVAARTRQIDDEKTALRREINARIKAEEYLERSHTLLDSIFEHIPGMIVLKRASDLRVARINRSAEKTLGRSRDFLIGRSSEEIFSPETADFFTQTDRQVLQHGGLLELPIHRVDMPAETQRWIRYRKSILRDRNGQPQYILEFGEDVTEREILDRQFKEQLHFLKQLIDAFPGPVFSKDLDGRYLAVNHQFEKFLGISREQLLGKTVHDVLPKEVADEYEAGDQALLKSGGSRSSEASVRRRDGRVAEIMLYKAAILTQDGKTSGVVGIALDISERKAAERDVVRLNRVLTILSEINKLIIYTRDRQRLLEDVRRIIQDIGGFPGVWIKIHDGKEDHLIATQGLEPVIRSIYIELDKPSRHCWPTRNLHCQSMHCCDQGLSGELQKLGLKSMLHLPLQSGEMQWGDIGILGAIDQVFSDHERELLNELAANLSYALESIHQEERRRIAEDKLELSARVFENNTEGIIISDADNRILMVNKAFTALTGYRADEVIGKTPSILSSGRHDKSFYRQIWATLARDGEWRGEIVNRRKNGEDFPEWLTISVVRGEDGRILNHVAVFSDLSARRKIEERLDFLAHHDSLTALPNREHFHRRLEQTLVEAKHNGQRVAVLYLDLDRFKLINESAGHTVGDLLLVEVASRLLSVACSREDVARLGGDQFAVMVPAMASPERAEQFVAELQEILGKPFLDIIDQDIHISASIGVSVYPEDSEDADTLLLNADSAMYKAIEDGGNTHRFFHQAMNERASERISLEGKLYHALERGELSVVFQPFVQAETGRVVGAEALLRWHREDLGGSVSPTIFIPLMEEIGLIRQVGKWVLNRACQEVKRWQAIAGDEIFVAVNISALQLDADLPGIVANAIAEYGISPRQLEIELTESAVMRDAERGIELLHRLKALGIQLSIDDFGTGYSSLSYLKRLPMTTLKIDRSFVSDMPGDLEAVSITRAILALGRSLNLNIIAEGVEAREQVELLRDNGCDLLQGYYFAAAMTADAFRCLLKEAPVYSMPPRTQPIRLIRPEQGKRH